MKFGELLDVYDGKDHDEYIDLVVDTTNKMQTVSTEAFQILDPLKDFYVNWFGISNPEGKLVVHVTQDEKPF